MVRPAGPAICPPVKPTKRPDVMLRTRGKQPDDGPDKAWLWIVGSMTLVLLGIRPSFTRVLPTAARYRRPRRPNRVLVCNDASS